MASQYSPLYARRWIILIFGLVAGILCLSLLWRVIAIIRQDNDPSLYDQRSKRLEHEIDQLKSDLEKQQSPFYEEKVIRDQLNMQKPDEVVLQLPSPTASPTSSPLPNER